MALDRFFFALLLLLYFAFASGRFLGRLRRFAWCRRNASILVAALLLPFAILAWRQTAGGSAFIDAVGAMSLYLAVPAWATLYRPRQAAALHPLDILAILAIWFPIEFDWLPDVATDVAIRLSSDLHFPAATFTAILFALLNFLVLRPLPGLGFDFRLRRADLLPIAGSLGLYSLVGIPLGLATRFLLFGLAPFHLGQWLGMALLGYLFTALPEELLFRGIMQNQIQQRLGRKGPALLLAALIFGLAHLNNSTPGFDTPNWMYALMAGLAGLAYGWSWQKTGKITASAVVHASVNFIWGILLSGG